MKYKTIIFDLDGTLLNTLEDLRLSVNHSFHSQGINVNFSSSDIKSFIGNGVKVLYERAFQRVPNLDEEVKREIFHEHVEYYQNHRLDHTVPFEGVVSTLKLLKNQGIQLGVISNKNDDDTKAVVDYFFNDIFDFVIGNKENLPIKPNPLLFYLLANEYNFTNSNTLYVGDSIVDVTFAKNCEMDSALCLYGFGDYSKEMNPTYKINSFNELLNLEK